MRRLTEKARTIAYLEELVSLEPRLGSGGMDVGTSYRLRLALRDPRIPPENPGIITKAFEQLRQVRMGMSVDLPPYPGDGQTLPALLPFRRMGPSS